MTPSRRTVRDPLAVPNHQPSQLFDSIEQRWTRLLHQHSTEQRT
jgi:hypothetical protein